MSHYNYKLPPRAQRLPSGYSLVEITGDGNCAYRSLAQAGFAGSVGETRKLVADGIKGMPTEEWQELLAFKCSKLNE